MVDQADATSLIHAGRCFRRGDIAVPRGQFDGLLRRGEIRRVLHGVYVDARRADDTDLRMEALGWVLPTGAAVARGSAAWLYGVDMRPPGGHEEAAQAECVVPTGVVPLRHPGVRCYSAPLDGDVVEMLGLPCTTPLRTAVDLLRTAAPHMALAGVDALARLGYFTPAELLAETGRWRGMRNVRRAVRLAKLCDPAAESFGESWTRLRIVDAGFPRPSLQIPVTLSDGATFRLDMGFENRLVAVEYDGMEFHSQAHQLRHDARRRAAIEQETGWRILPVGRGEILGSSLAFELGLGELLGMEPTISRRSW